MGTEFRLPPTHLVCSKVHFGAVWPVSFTGVLRAKVGDSNTRRKIALEGYRFTPQDGIKAGFLDHLVSGSTAEVLAKAEQVADSVSSLANTGVWGLIKARHHSCYPAQSL